MPVHDSSPLSPGPAVGPPGAEPVFETPAGLRALLERLHAAGKGAWRADPDATALLAYTIERYAPLARSWHRDPGEAASAAFVAMLHDGVRRAEDPWAVVTRAVQVSLSAESHADRHLTSTEKARRTQHTDGDIPVRAGELTDNLTIGPSGAPGPESEPEAEPALADATLFLCLLGWPEPVTGMVVEYVAGRLADAGSITAAYEMLRRDLAMRAHLDLDRAAWSRLLGVLLGSRPQPGRPTRKGVLARLLLGEGVRDLLDDNRLVQAALVCHSRPHLPASRAAEGGVGE